jgi:hypothetical protein
MPSEAHGRCRERVREGSRHGYPMKDGMGGIEIVEENHMPILVVRPILVGHLRDRRIVPRRCRIATSYPPVTDSL